jgi:hypothetical protein
MKNLHLPGIISLGLFVFLLLVLPAGVVALESFSGQQVSINSPVADDVFAAGGSITVNAPIDSLVAAGGTITLNAPVKGDVIVAGGRIIANNNIGGKLVAAGGTVDVNGDVGTNAVITGGKVTINPRSTIGRDAEISGGTVTSSGHIMGNLSVQSQNFYDSGTVGEKSSYVQTREPSLSKIFTILGILFSIGWLILGLLLLKIAPLRYRIVVGFVGLVVAGIALVILAITIIGLPVALVSGLFIVIGVIFSVLFVSSAIGRLLFRWLKVEIQDWHAFVAGFVVLSILFRIPVAGIILLIITICLGFGALLYAVNGHWKIITGTSG